MAAAAAAAAAAATPLAIFFPSRNPSPRPCLLPLPSKNGKNGSDLSPEEGDLSECSAIVPLPHHRRVAALSPLSKDAAMGLTLSAAAGRGWTTGSGMEGPSIPASPTANATENISTFPWSLFTKSPRRRMRVAFTCNVCGQRTTRAINPHAYTDGTVFVQCCGCNIFHKLVDNLNLFHEMKCYVSPSFRYRNPERDGPFNLFDLDDDNGGDDIFPLI